MDNVSVIVNSEMSSTNNDDAVIHLGGFDLEEALAMVAGEPPRLLLAASKSYVSKLPAVEDDVLICSVCMEQLSSVEKSGGGSKRVPCGHVYHSECITLWLSHCDSCPLCRRHIPFLH